MDKRKIKLLDDAATRELYLSKLREKHGRDEAARLIGVNPSTVWRYCQSFPEFLLEIQDAEAAKIETAHKFWFKVMNDEEMPIKDRLRASELLEKTFGRDAKKDQPLIESTTNILISGDSAAELLELQRKLQDRRRPESVILELDEPGEDI
jgi:hypothetical protein|tara:strand:+ start:93 stop:545 length:453 start_codon:yes stop_codon:yes gene_type:complete